MIIELGAESHSNHNRTQAIKTFLDDVYGYYHKEEFIGTDPLVYPRNALAKGAAPHEVEYIGFLSAMFAYGNVKAIQVFLANLFDEYGTNPFQIPISAGNSTNKNLYYRFQSPQDIRNTVELIAKAYQEHGSLQGLMDSCNGGRVVDRYEFAAMKAGFNNYFRNNMELTRGVKMLFADVEKSAAKRLSMFLRWMIRKDSIDLGLWAKYSPEILTIPLDVHVLQFSQYAGLISNSNTSKKNMEIVTSFFNQITPQDPTKYDFSLTRPGIIHGCTFTLHKKVCYNCPQQTTCKIISWGCS